jgi:hypothetical protein
MTKANRSKVVRSRTRRRGTKRRGGAGASASRRSHGSPQCEWRVTSSSVDREDGDIEDFGDGHPHPTVHFSDIAGKNGQIKNNQLRDTLRRTCNEESTTMIVQRGIRRVTHVSRSRQMLSFYHDGVCVGYVTVTLAPTGRVPVWMVRHSPNPRRSPHGTKYPNWMTTSQSVDPAEPIDNNALPTVDLGEIVGENGEITQTSLREMLSHTCDQVNTRRVLVQGITNVTHVMRVNSLLYFQNDDTFLGSIVVRAMGDKQPSWMRR